MHKKCVGLYSQTNIRLDERKQNTKTSKHIP